MYGLLISLGILVSTLVSEKLAKKENLTVDVLWEGLPFILIFAILGARLYHTLDFWEYYSQNPQLIFAIWKGGLGILGGLISGGITLILFLKYKRQPIGKWLNIISVSIPLAQAVGRMGNFFNNEIYGTGPIPFFALESFLDLLLFFMLFLYFKKFKKNTFSLYLMGYGTMRFLLEFLREDSWKINYVNITQTVCLSLVTLGFLTLEKKNKMLQ